MRKLTLSNHQFDTFVFGQVALQPASNDAEFETSIRLMRKLKDPTLTQVVEPSDEERSRVRPGTRLYPYHRLREAQATFVLEEDEWMLLRTRVEAHKTQVAALVAEDFAALLALIADPPRCELDPQTMET